MPQSFGTDQRLNASQRRVLAHLHHPKRSKAPDWPTWQYSRGAVAAVWRKPCGAWRLDNCGVAEGERTLQTSYSFVWYLRCHVR